MELSQGQIIKKPNKQNELSQEQIIQKPNKQELSSLFMTHRLNVMHAPVKFHKYIPYGLGVMAHTRFTIWN